MSGEHPPKYAYKILPISPPQALPVEYPLSQLDQNDGFVHLSTATQVPQTCDLFFTQASELWVLKLDFSKVEAATKWENGFPHLYGNFGAKEVVSSYKFIRNDSHKWSEGMKGSVWLE